MLEHGVVRATQRVAEGERHEEGAGRLHLLRVLADHADRRGRDALGLERARQHTAGVRAEGSGRRDQRDLDALVAQASADLGAGLLLDALEIPLRAHERVVMRPRAAQLAPRADEVGDDAEAEVLQLGPRHAVPERAEVLREHVGDRWHLWSNHGGTLRPLDDRFPEPISVESQIWVRAGRFNRSLTGKPTEAAAMPAASRRSRASNPPTR